MASPYKSAGQESPLGAVSRRALLKGTAALAAAASGSAWADDAPNRKILAYVGSYNGAVGAGGNGQGIYLFSMDPKTGILTQIKVASTVPSPSWIEIDPKGNFLYAVNEISNFNGSSSGSVSSFAINRTTGDLAFLNAVSSQGAGPAHLSVHPSGKFVFVANYGGGTIAVLPVLANGSLGDASDVRNDVGSAPVGPIHATSAPPGSFAISGHNAPHAHMMHSDPTGNFVLSTDLGEDRIFVWGFDKAAGKLSATPAQVVLPPGDGPRHFAFHPNGRWLYSIQEEASTMVFFDYANGVVTQRQMLSSLPKGFVGTNFTSEIRVSQNGRFVYGANRLHDTVAVFSVNGDGTLEFVDEASTLGDYPRSFTIDPTNSFLYTCNQRGDALATFRVDGDGRQLRFTGQYVPVGGPSIIVFLT